MQKSNLYSSAIFVILGLFFINPSLELGLRSPTSDGVPGAGFFPFVMAVGLIGLGLFIFITTFFRMRKGLLEESIKLTNKMNMKNTLVLMVSLPLYILLWKFTNYYISTIIISLFLNWFFKRGVVYNLVFSTGFTFIMYFVFNLGLRIQFVL